MKPSSLPRKVKTLALLLLSTAAFAQNTPEDYLAAALQNHPLAKAAAHEVQAKRYAERTAATLPAPEVNIESPTGEFYVLGVSQAFEFPTVYRRQKQVARAETELARASQRMQENDLYYAVHTLYLDAQVAEYRARQWARRDSLHQAAAAAAARQFAAGEIDFLQKTMTELEAGKARQEHLSAEQNAAAARHRLEVYTGLTTGGALLPLAPAPDTSARAPSPPSVAYRQQAMQVAEEQLRLAKSRALPNFSLGYLNQGPHSTPVDYRFRASVGVPLWFGSYRAGRKAAEENAHAARSQADAEAQAVALELERAGSEAANARTQVQYFQTEALPRSQALLDAAARMREAGQIDYLAFLRTLDEVFALQEAYTGHVQALNAAQLQQRYLAGFAP